jgi:nitrogen fixation NifU-like protein
MDTLYQENILDHAHNPRNMRVIDNCTCHAKGDNPSCGDTGELYIKIENDIVSDASFVGVGCAISQASLSMMTEYIVGKNVHELKMIMPGNVYEMLGVSITPSRVNCALLSYRALEQLLLNCDSI